MAPKQTRLPAPQRRALLLTAAGSLFGEHGYDGVTLEQVAIEAGVTKPVLYRHFDSKRALYLALLQAHATALPSFLPGRVDPANPPALEPILDHWLAYAEANPHAWQMLFRDAGGDEGIRDFRAAVSAEATRVLCDFLHAHPAIDLPPSQLEPTGEILRGGLAAMVLWWQRHPDVPREVLVAAAVGVIGGLAE